MKINNKDGGVFNQLIKMLGLSKLRHNIVMCKQGNKNDNLNTFLTQIKPYTTNDLMKRLNDINAFQEQEINNRLLTVEWLLSNNRNDIEYLIGCVNQIKIDSEINSLKEKRIHQKFELVNERNLAFDSNDFQEPESTTEGMGDASWFIYEIEKLITKKQISFLDIGCGSGALPFQFLKNGHFSVGLDGSDFCKNSKKGYWIYNDLLKTCDVTKNFHIEINNETRKFDIVTMWEVFEHIPEDQIKSVLSNVFENLEQDGFFIGSISKLEYSNPKTGNVYHVTLMDFSWWKEKFEESGFIMIDLPIPPLSCFRGVGNRYQDPHSYIDNPETGFHFCAIKAST